MCNPSIQTCIHSSLFDEWILLRTLLWELSRVHPYSAGARHESKAKPHRCLQNQVCEPAQLIVWRIHSYYFLSQEGGSEPNYIYVVDSDEYACTGYGIGCQPWNEYRRSFLPLLCSTVFKANTAGETNNKRREKIVSRVTTVSAAKTSMTMRILERRTAIYVQWTCLLTCNTYGFDVDDYRVKKFTTIGERFSYWLRMGSLHVLQVRQGWDC